jgi:hypothetical protein
MSPTIIEIKPHRRGWKVFEAPDELQDCSHLSTRLTKRDRLLQIASGIKNTNLP